MLSSKKRKESYTTDEIGRRFLEYYQSLDYKIIPGSSLLDPSVPMTFVMSAGLVQVETSAGFQGDSSGNRYTMIQNCFRYFDLPQIGKSPHHLSLFQMPGAFTFGPQNKEKCIADIRHLLSGIYNLPSDSLWATYFKGGNICGIFFEPDAETREAWKRAGIPDKQIVPLNADHNFWKQGPGIVGENHAAKCGPNTEIFFDRGADKSCGIHCLPGCGCGRFVEIMNTLFISFHLEEVNGTVKDLDEPFTETVIGLERLAMLLQGRFSVFDTDMILPLIEYIRTNTGTAGKNTLLFERMIADHIRALLFLTADGAPPPGKGGRARLMRKLVRQMLTAQKMLEITNPNFPEYLKDTVLKLYKDQSPHLMTAGDKAMEYIRDETKRFEKTLQKGFRHLDDSLKKKKIMQSEKIREFEKRHGIPRLLLKKRLAEVPANNIQFYEKGQTYA